MYDIVFTITYLQEVGLKLRALAFGKDIDLYVASGHVYGGDNTLGNLRCFLKAE